MFIKKISNGTISKRKDGIFIGQAVVTFEDNSKRRICVSDKDEIECISKLSTKKNEMIYLSENADIQKETYMKYLLTKWLAEKEQEGCNLKTLSNHKYTIHKYFTFFGDMSADEITMNHLLQFQNNCIKNKGLAVGTFKKFYSILNNSFKKMIRDKIVEKNPCEYFQLCRGDEKEKELFTESEIEQIFYEAKIHDKTTNKCKLIYPFLLFAYTTGCRRGEISALKWEDVNIKKLTVTIKHAIVVVSNKGGKPIEYISTTKNKKSRTVPITKKLLDELLKIKSKSPFVFYDYRDNKRFISPRSISNVYIRIQKKTGIKKGLHTFRHYYISKALESGLSLKLVMKLAGHSNINTTQRYWHYDKSKYDSVRNLFS